MTERRGLGRLTGAMTTRVVEAIDPDTVLEHIDVNALLDRVDIDRLLDRIDIERLLSRVDVDQLLARADIEALVRRSGVPEIVAESTGRFAGSALDTARRQVVVVDLLTAHVVDALFRRRRYGWAHAPALLRPTVPPLDRRGRLDLSGRYAGWVSRLVASIADVWIAVTSGTLLLAGADFLGRKAFGGGAEVDVTSPVWISVFVLAGFGYLFLSLEVAGRTPGDALVGLRVVAWDGGRLGARAAFGRTVLLPLTTLTIIGPLGAVIHRDRRALHDRLTRSAVVYDWAPRPVHVPASIAESLLQDSPRPPIP